jgi:tetratricopeptide (TPR) repeat protein
MAENPLEGLIGGKGEDGPDAPGAGTPDVVAMAVAMSGAKLDPQLSRRVGAYLEKQERLVEIQTEHLHEQRAVQLSHLKLRRDSEAFKVALQALFALILAGVTACLIFMAWSATQDHGLVVEPFSVPPALAQRGVTGQVVAQDVLDRLSSLQSQTVSARPANSYRNNWSDNLKVEIPETGVSLGEVQRLLNAWLGHETHISGEVVQSAGGLTISARADAGAVARVSGPETDIDALIQQAAEAVYGQTQPYRHAIYLNTHGKLAQGREILETLTGTRNSLERAWAYIGLGVGDALSGDLSAAARHFALAGEAAPNLIDVKLSLALFVETPLEHEESALRLERFVLAHKAAFKPQVSPDAWGNLLNEMGDGEVAITHDAGESLRLRKAADRGESGLSSSWRAVSDLLHGILTHDPAEMRQVCATLAGGPAQRRLWLSAPRSQYCLGLAAFVAHDPASVGLLTAAMTASLTAPSEATSAKRDGAYWLARAKAAFGDLAGAKALIFATPTDCHECVVGRGEILAQGGDRAGAEKWFAEAISQGPDIPLAFTARGEARLIWGDAAGALADGQAATKISPNDPDALKLWGDALARQGQGKAAREKYDAALKLAPNWTDLQKARAAAAKA